MISFFVTGTPVPQGSPKVTSIGGKPRMYEGKLVRAWRDEITATAKNYAADAFPKGAALGVHLAFYFKRPKSHYCKHGLTAAGRRTSMPATRPDIDKLARAVLDGITDAGLWHDDGQVAVLSCSKWYSVQPGVLVKIAEVFCA